VPKDRAGIEPWLCPEPDFRPGDLERVIAGTKSRGPSFRAVRPDGDGRPTIFLVAAGDDGATAVAALSTEHFIELQKAVTFGEKGHAAIVDQAGNLLAHPDAAVAAAMRNIADAEPVRRMIGGETGVAEFRSPISKADMIAGHAVVPAVGWGIMVGQPLVELERNAASGRSAAIAIMVICILAAAMASWLFSRYLTRSITPIVRAANANAAGHFGTETLSPHRFTPTDLRQLAASFNVMAREIRVAYERQVQALVAARRAEADFRGIFENATEGIYRSTREGRLLRANPALVRLNGYDSEAALLAAMTDIATQWYVDPERRAAILDLIEQQGQVTDVVSEMRRHKTRERIWVSENARAVRGAGGELLYIEGTVVDITERKRAEAATYRAIAAESVNQTKSEFLATLSHELRTPLNAIIGFSEIMRDGTFGPLGSQRYVQYTRGIHVSGKHLLSLIDDLLDLSRIEGEQYRLQEETLDLSELIPDVIRLIEPEAVKARVDIRLEIQGGLPPLLADSRATKQILLNLLSNAVKFTPRHGQVTVKAYLDDGAINIYVEDNGIGIAPEDIGKVLAPFGQVEDQLTRRSKGTGLGLPIVKSLVELHRGDFRLGSQPGRGTAAAVVFPADRSVRRTNGH
jgi:PAS domain S-box-containing protein